MNPSPDIRAWLIAACVCLWIGAAVIVAPFTPNRGWFSAANTSAPALRLPVFAHRPMGTQH